MSFLLQLIFLSDNKDSEVQFCSEASIDICFPVFMGIRQNFLSAMEQALTYM